MKITEIPGAGETAALQKTLNEKMIGAYDADGSLKVKVQPADEPAAPKRLRPAARE